MPIHFIDIDAKRLSNLHEALEILESVDREGVRALDLTVYGLTSDQMLVDAAKEAIADSEDVAEEDVQLSEIAVALPLSSDYIYYLAGSGLRIQREEFAYMGGGGEGIRQQSFISAHFKPTVSFKMFSKLAIASSDAWLDDFLRQEGSGKPAQVKQNVRRTEEATQPGVPAAPAQPPALNRQTSSQKISQLLDIFLS